MSFFLLLSVLLALLLIWMNWIEPEWRKLSRCELFLKKPFPGPVRILHLSDTHFSGRDKSLSRFFDRLAEEDMDFVFVTGDIIDWDGGIDSCVENLKKLKPAYGIFVVFGNHDYYNFRFLDVFIHNFPGQTRPLVPNAVDIFQKKLEASGVKVLMNNTAAVDREGASLLIHGLDDPTTGRANLLKAMQNFDSQKINILLTHTVDVFLDIGENQIDLSFSGHSHGGQIRLPFLGPIITHTSMGRPYAAGIFDLKGAVCCVSRGLNASRFLKARLLCPPEAILLTVHGKRT